MKRNEILKRMAALAAAGTLVIGALAGCSSGTSGGGSSQTAASTAASTAGAAASEAAQADTGASAAAAEAPATDFPTKEIKIIVPYDAGGGVDLTTRILADAAGKDYFNGHSLIVENKPGGGAVIGHTEVANAEPDGYTLLAYTSAIVNNPLLKDVTYTLEDFKTLGQVCFDPEILVVPTTAPYKTWEEFVEYGQSNTIKMSTPGHSTAHHIAGMQIEKLTGLKFEYLHNDGASVQTQQVLGGHCDAALMASGEVAAQVQEGTMIALAIGSTERSENLPDVPTFTELGVDLVYGAFRGYACPAGVPDDVYQVLVSEFDKIIQSDKFIQGMADAQIPYAYRNAADFQEYANNESKNLEPLVEDLLSGQ